ncbi:Sacsin [Ananas comosus]|uniref:Sacsin n=1 Tax=Ananas comosus TaxID=4615 RepID=A0A199UZ22_ANACO|nr:Sacsin [Ananas comosus]
MDRSAASGADAAAETALLEDFGQRVDLTRRIREVLVNYPEGTTVLKELIQNADDAGATRGPALVAYNDAGFTDDDFVSISRIGDSKKQSQAWKTGRFGNILMIAWIMEDKVGYSTVIRLGWNGSFGLS